MIIKIKWLSALGKRPVPAKYACTVSFENPPVELYSVVLHFPLQVRTWAELELLVVKDLVLPNSVFYITEDGTIVAEAQKYD